MPGGMGHCVPGAGGMCAQGGRVPGGLCAQEGGMCAWGGTCAWDGEGHVPLGNVFPGWVERERPWSSPSKVRMPQPSLPRQDLIEQNTCNLVPSLPTLRAAWRLSLFHFIAQFSWGFLNYFSYLFLSLLQGYGWGLSPHIQILKVRISHIWLDSVPNQSPHKSLPCVLKHTSLWKVAVGNMKHTDFRLYHSFGSDPLVNS